MSSIKEDVIGSFNEQINSIKRSAIKYSDQIISTGLVVFNGEVKELILQGSVSNIKKLDTDLYRSAGSTALLNAIGLTLNKPRSRIIGEIEGDEASVVVVILDTLNYNPAFTGIRLKKGKQIIPKVLYL